MQRQATCATGDAGSTRPNSSRQADDQGDESESGETWELELQLQLEMDTGGNSLGEVPRESSRMRILAGDDP